MSADDVQGNLNPVGRMFYAVSTLACTPNAVSQRTATSSEPLGAQAGERRLRALAARGRLHPGPQVERRRTDEPDLGASTLTGDDDGVSPSRTAPRTGSGAGRGRHRARRRPGRRRSVPDDQRRSRDRQDRGSRGARSAKAGPDALVLRGDLLGGRRDAAVLAVVPGPPREWLAGDRARRGGLAAGRHSGPGRRSDVEHGHRRRTRSFGCSSRSPASLQTLASPRPLLVVLDDLQWSDEPSLRLLGFLARTLATSRVLLLGAYRDLEASDRAAGPRRRRATAPARPASAGRRRGHGRGDRRPGRGRGE